MSVDESEQAMREGLFAAVDAKNGTGGFNTPSDAGGK